MPSGGDVVGKHGGFFIRDYSSTGMDFESFVLAASTGTLADADDPIVQTQADAIEFRMDLADDPLDALKRYDGRLPIIATNRVDHEGGEASATAERIATLKEAATQPAVEAIDIELSTLEADNAGDLLETVDTSIIVSSHEFAETPPAATLKERLETALAYGDVGKLAVTAEDISDVPPLLSVTAAVSTHGHVATMAMGEPGQHSRAVAPLYGSCIGYAPIAPGKATAPGQYDLTTLATLLETLDPTLRS